MKIYYKTPEQIEKIAIAGQLAAEVLDHVAPYVQAGITTAELDRICHDYMVNVQKSIPASLNYAPSGHNPYPNATCISVNHQICHGIPNDKVLKSGDILNIDLAVIKDGWHGDTSRMFMVGDVSTLAKRLCETTLECLWLGIDTAKPGNTIGDIGHVIQTYAEARGFSIVREFCGHGIGEHYHEAPQVVHYGQPGAGVVIKPGMVFTIEPMLNAGKRHIKELNDGWTIVTKDHSLSAQWEHTIAITETGCRVLTLSAGCPPRPASLPAV